MNHADSPDTTKKTIHTKGSGKSLQELYDASIRKGDEAIIVEDIILAEKYYQHADYYVRCMNDPHHGGGAPHVPRAQQPSTSPQVGEALVEKALKGIAAERAERKEVFMEKAREIARKKIKKSKAHAAQTNTKKVDKKRKNKGEA